MGRDSVTNLLRNGIDEDAADAWKANHVKAMECRDVEDALRTGLLIFSYLRLADDAWSRKVQLGAATFDPQHVRAIHAAYEWWLEPCASIAQHIESVEHMFEVEGAAEFRRAWTLARKLIATPLDDLLGAPRG